MLKMKRKGLGWEKKAPGGVVRNKEREVDKETGLSHDSSLTVHSDGSGKVREMDLQSESMSNAVKITHAC